MADSEFQKPPRFVLEITVFVCGALVMIYEIIGSRLVSPFIGSSTYVWTSLIGVILAALSLGYWLGGRLADRRPDLKYLASTIFLAGGAVAVTTLLKDIVLSLIGQSSMILELKAVLASLLLFAPASVLLGFVTPFAVKLKMMSLEDSGKTVGRLYALSTVGSILGTFLAGFVLIPFVGSTRTLYIIVAALIGLSLLLAPFSLTRSTLTTLIVFSLAIFTTEVQSYYLLRFNELRDIDTEYNRVQIFTMDDADSGRKVRAMAMDPYFIQSKMYLDSDELASEYLKYYHLVSHYNPSFQKSLMIGGAGYSFPKDYLRKYPGRQLDVVEIDPQMTEIARKYFRLEDHSNSKIIHEDGRTFLNRAPTAEYDAVFLDAFSSLFTVPFHLTTTEAVREIKRVLKPEGVVIFNLGSALEGAGSRFFAAELATYREQFSEVFVFKVRPERRVDEVQNIIIVAGNNARSADNPFPAEFEALFRNRYDAAPTAEAPLTDDLAPVEHFGSLAQRAKN